MEPSKVEIYKPRSLPEEYLSFVNNYSFASKKGMTGKAFNVALCNVCESYGFHWGFPDVDLKELHRMASHWSVYIIGEDELEELRASEGYSHYAEGVTPGDWVACDAEVIWKYETFSFAHEMGSSDENDVLYLTIEHYLDELKKMRENLAQVLAEWASPAEKNSWIINSKTPFEPWFVEELEGCGIINQHTLVKGVGYRLEFKNPVGQIKGLLDR